MTAVLSDWYSSAACAELDVELFYPLSGTGYVWPKAICRGCPVVEQCGAYALAVEHGWGIDRRHGVWGGMDPQERWERERA